MPDRMPAVPSITSANLQVIQTGPGETVVWVNRLFCRMRGGSKSSWSGRPLSDADAYPWGPGFLAVVAASCTESAPEAVRDRLYTDPKTGLESAFRITVRRISSGFQFAIEDRTPFLNIERRFRRYVSPKILELMKEEGRDFESPRRYELSVLFADLRGFTALSEQWPPETVRDTVNAYLECVEAAVDACDAMVDKIVGDEVMVLCGAPVPRKDHTVQAVKVALEIRKAHAALKKLFAAQGRVMPEVGISVHSGSMVAGCVGTGKQTDYTVMGRNVNIAFQLSREAKAGEILVTGSVRECLAAQNPGLAQRLSFEDCGQFPVKGTGITVPVFRLSAPDKTVLKLDEPDLAAHTRILRERRVFGKYRILSEIGRGGMGIVYRAVHYEIGKIVALKVLRNADTALESQMRMFQREIEMLAAVQHPNIISIHEVGITEGSRYFTMDFIDGCTLHELMSGHVEAGTEGRASSIREVIEFIQRRSSPASDSDATPRAVRVGRFRSLKLSQSLHLMLKMLAALEYIHDRGILHRDIKPSNILVTKDGEPVLMDFGLARNIALKEGAAPLTQDGQVLGTPAYMSPEQSLGQRDNLTEKSDIYSMGAMFYEMLTGRPPIPQSGNLINDINAVASTEPEPIGRLNASVPRDVRVICEKALEKDPARRYRTAGAFAEDIRRFINGDPIMARPQSVIYRIRKKAAKYPAVTVACLLLLAGLAGYLTVRRQTRAQISSRDRTIVEARKKTEARWMPAYSADFENSSDTSDWFVIKPEINSISARIENGRLVLRDRGRYFCKKQVPGNIRVTFLAAAEGGNEIGFYFKNDESFGEECVYYRFFWNDDIIKWRREGMFRNTGRVLINDRYFAREKEIANLSDHPGRFFHIELSVEDGVCRAIIDRADTLVCDDVFPVQSMNAGYWGFRSIVGTLTIDSLRVYRQLLPERVEIFRIADALAQEGLTAPAIRQLDGIINHYDDAMLINQCTRKLLAMAGFTGDTRIYENILDRKPMVGRILAVADPATITLLLEGALYSTGRNPPSPRLAETLLRHSESLHADSRFSFYVWLAFYYSGMGFFEQADIWHAKALLVKPDSVIERLRKHGPNPPVAIKLGSQALVPAGYVPKSFGICVPAGPFLMDTTEVTRALYTKIMGSCPEYEEKSAGMKEDGLLPVRGVRMLDAIRFCNKRSIIEGFEPYYTLSGFRDTVLQVKIGKIKRHKETLVQDYTHQTVRDTTFNVSVSETADGYRLPVIEEYEHAQRAGRTGEYFWSGTSESADDYAWFNENSGLKTHPVARKKANPYGLYDLFGNTAELCFEFKTLRVPVTGGSASSADYNMRCGYTSASLGALSGTGFRCVRPFPYRNNPR